MDDFSQSILSWYQQHGRHELPWKQDITAYRVWVSEIMLQQTQVNTVIPYYERFMQRFADVNALADAAEDEVLHLWTGLGYYARARNLHRAAKMVCEQYSGDMPKDIDDLMSLPGIGRSTAGAILSLSFNQSQPILDGNVKRVLCRYHAITGWPGEKKVENRLWEVAASHTPSHDAADYTQAIMDLGAMICVRSNPLCQACPVEQTCQALQQGLQFELPHKKPKKAIPVKQTIFALIENSQGQILLQKRPPAGIWGGLWSFPECPVDQDLALWLNEHFGFVVKESKKEPGLRHTFSHFHLDIQPVRARLEAEANVIAEHRDVYWHQPGEKLELGLAAPVKKLIDSL